jgi:putative transposase
MDFMQDMLADGRRFPTLTMLDIVTHDCLAIAVDTSLPDKRVVRLLDQLLLRHGTPERITLDNGPEFTGRALDVWAYDHGIVLDSSIRANPCRTGTWRASTADSATSARIFTGFAV